MSLKNRFILSRPKTAPFMVRMGLGLAAQVFRPWEPQALARVGSILVLVILGFFCRVSVAQELIQVPAAIDISSTASEGGLSICKIAEIARDNNIKIVILADRDFMRWQYGLWPLRRIIKKTVEINSLSTYGIERYLKEIKGLQKNNPDLVIIPGVESAPFYYWSGSLFRDNLKINDWHKHILVMGLDEAGDYKDLPSVSNDYSLLLPFKLKDIWRLWPVLTLVLGVLYLRVRQPRLYLCARRIIGITVIIISLLFLFNNFPFRTLQYDQYHGDQGIGPYQNFINYVNQRGGLTFWSHPEAENIQKRGRVSIETREHSDILLDTYNYTGFSIFYEGYNKAGCPGGIWDEVLREYCQGIRKAAVWVIGGLCFDRARELASYIKDLRTVFLIPELSKTAVLAALRKGRMYVVRGEESSQFILDKFIVSDALTGVNVTMGEKLSLKDKPTIEIGGHFLNGQKQTLKIKLIRNGSIIKTFEVNSPFEIRYQDDYDSGGEGFYYRLEIQSPVVFVITNPIFAKRQ